MAFSPSAQVLKVLGPAPSIRRWALPKVPDPAHAPGLLRKHHKIPSLQISVQMGKITAVIMGDCLRLALYKTRRLSKGRSVRHRLFSTLTRDVLQGGKCSRPFFRELTEPPFLQFPVIVLVVGVALAAPHAFEAGFDSFEHSAPGGASPFSPPISFVRPPHQEKPPINCQTFQKPHGPPSPGEIASAIQAAKEAAASVMAAQRRVQDAKQEVLQAQHAASQKQADAALALQRTEAAAAVQQQQSKAAAQSVVMAQQRLAQAKTEVSEAQRVAAHKEAHAAALIQKSASAAAHQIEKNGNSSGALSLTSHFGLAHLLQTMQRAKSPPFKATRMQPSAKRLHPSREP